MSQMARSKIPIILHYHAINTCYHVKTFISVPFGRNIVILVNTVDSKFMKINEVHIMHRGLAKQAHRSNCHMPL